MSHFSGHFEGASTFLTPKLSQAHLRGQKSLGPLKMSLEMAHTVIVPQKIRSRSFLNSGTLIVNRTMHLHYGASTDKLIMTKSASLMDVIGVLLHNGGS